MHFLLLPITLWCVSLQETEVGDPLAGFKIGSWVKMQHELKGGNEVKTVIQLSTITSIINGSPTVRVEFSDNRPSRTQTHVFGWRPLESSVVSSEATSIIIDKLSIPCTKKEYVYRDDNKLPTKKITYWLSDKELAPYREVANSDRDLAVGRRVLKCKYETQAADLKIEIDLVVTSLHKKHSLKDEELDCVEETVDIKDAHLNGRMTRLLSQKVPSHEVRSEFLGTMNGKKVFASSSVLEYETK